MYIRITTDYTHTEGPTIIINCPKCGARGTSAATTGIEEQSSLFWTIPLHTTQYTNVTCWNCRKAFQIVKSLREVVRLTPEAISDALASSVPFLIRFCTVTGLVLFWAPIFGFVFSGIGLASTARKPTGWKVAAIIGFILSLVLTTAAIIAAMLTVE